VNRTSLLGGLLQFGVVVGGFFSGHLTVTLALVGSSVGILAPWVALRFAARRLGRGRFTWARIRESVAFGLKSSLGVSFLYLMYRIDFVIVKILLGASVLGQYSVGTSVAELLWLVTDSLAIALISRQVEGSFSNALDLTIRAVRRVLVVLPVAGVFLGAFGIVAIPLVFGAAFRPSVGPMLILLPGVAALGAVKPITLLIIRSNRPTTMSLISTAGLTVNLGLLIPLARRFGIDGAAVASTVAYSAIAVLYVAWVRSRGVRLRELLPKHREVRSTVRLLSPSSTLSAMRLLVSGGGSQRRVHGPMAGPGPDPPS
jgi:O-antigen/teichoic acid export membrane protein